MNISILIYKFSLQSLQFSLHYHKKIADFKL